MPTLEPHLLVVYLGKLELILQAAGPENEKLVHNNVGANDHLLFDTMLFGQALV